MNISNEIISFCETNTAFRRSTRAGNKEDLTNTINISQVVNNRGHIFLLKKKWNKFRTSISESILFINIKTTKMINISLISSFVHRNNNAAAMKNIILLPLFNEIDS